MQNRILVLVIIVLSIVLILVSSNEMSTTFFNSSPKIAVKNTSTNNVEKMDIEEYIVGVVAAEMPASFNIEALKAQAVASRTYAYYKMESSNGDYDVVTDVSNQSYITVAQMQEKWGSDYNKYYEKIKEAVLGTKGLVMLYNDKIVEAYYFAMSNGYTEDVSLVFSEERDYLKSVESLSDRENKNFLVETKISKQEFCTKLEINCNAIVIKSIERSRTNRVNSIVVNDKTFKGTVFRTKLGLRSTDFDIDIKNDFVHITTRGYGHGVGMSQYGANEMAKSGNNYENILKYYYKNIKISSI